HPRRSTANARRQSPHAPSWTRFQCPQDSCVTTTILAAAHDSASAASSRPRRQFALEFAAIPVQLHHGALHWRGVVFERKLCAGALEQRFGDEETQAEPF